MDSDRFYIASLYYPECKCEFVTFERCPACGREVEGDPERCSRCDCVVRQNLNINMKSGKIPLIFDSLGDSDETGLGCPIRIVMQAGARKLNIESCGLIKPRQLEMKMDMETARWMADTKEITGYRKQGIFELAGLKSEKLIIEGIMIPKTLYGINISLF